MKRRDKIEKYIDKYYTEKLGYDWERQCGPADELIEDIEKRTENKKEITDEIIQTTMEEIFDEWEAIL